MSRTQSFAIETAGHAAGIVIAGRSGYQFFAADDRFSSLDGRVFKRPQEAERAARRIVGELRVPPRFGY